MESSPSGFKISRDGFKLIQFPKIAAFIEYKKNYNKVQKDDEYLHIENYESGSTFSHLNRSEYSLQFYHQKEEDIMQMLQYEKERKLEI